MNGIVPFLTGRAFGGNEPSLLERGLATYGSDSGHQMAFPPGGRRGAGPPAGGPPPPGRAGADGPAGGIGRGGPPSITPNPVTDDWALNEEAIRNLGHMQLKKTHDAAMVLIERGYGERPRFNDYIGSSQGGRLVRMRDGRALARAPAGFRRTS